MEDRTFVMNEISKGIFDTFYLKSSKIWFLDSMVIYELKVVEQPPDGQEQVGYTYPVFKYTFHDLRTMRCQDYFSFTDTASVQCNYQLTNTETVLYRFWKYEPPFEEMYFDLGDTMIGNRKVKMIEKRKAIFSIDNYNIAGKDYTEHNNGYREILYIECGVPDNIFHINYKAEQRYPNCKVVRRDGCDLQNNSRRCTENMIITSKLTENERAVFKQWSENARTTKVPAIKYTESFQRCGSAQSPIYPKDF